MRRMYWFVQRPFASKDTAMSKCCEECWKYEDDSCFGKDCKCHAAMSKPAAWEGEFDREIFNSCPSYPMDNPEYVEKIKQFIREQISRERARVVGELMENLSWLPRYYRPVQINKNYGRRDESGDIREMLEEKKVIGILNSITKGTE